MTAYANPEHYARLDPAPTVPKITPVIFHARKTSAPQRPAVRIFVGTEAAQHRAERIFFYALARVRDPDRRYEIYRMRDLPGFDRRRWRTGFTNYRFAIPDLAGHCGRAIYNDVDQIYSVDPAALFDTDMAGHGYLALSPQDTAVMLVDCARMAAVWPLTGARSEDKKHLLRVAAATPGLWGPLDPAWHARDNEYVPGRSRLLHYTALHTQPWRPTPARYSYHPHPRGELWLNLERSADAEGYQIYGPEQPSPRFEHACTVLDRLPSVDNVPTPSAQALLRRMDCRTIERFGPIAAGAQSPVAASVLKNQGRGDDAGCDAILASGLEVFSADDLPWLLEALFRRASRVVYLAVRTDSADAPADRESWWRDALRRTARRHPDRCWHLDFLSGNRPVHSLQSDFAARESPPRVWVLEGLHGGDNAQLRALAKRVGWTWVARRPVFEPRARLPVWLFAARSRHFQPRLAPPWPDVVMIIGRRTATTARWIRRRSGGRARIVLLGRAQAPLNAFDLVVTTPQYGLPLRENVMCLPAPLTEPPPAPADPAVAAWSARFSHLPRPWIAVLVGGSRRPYRFTAQAASALGKEASQAAAKRGGSVLVVTSPRTDRTAVNTLFTAIDGPAYCHRYQPDGAAEDNPYRALLVLADAYIVTGESASMLTEACATGKPVAVFELPVHRDRLRLRLKHWVERRLGLIERATGSRGTPRQQHRAGRLYDRLVAAGLIRRERRMGDIHRALGVRTLPEGLDTLPALGPRELEQAYAEATAGVRDMLREPHVERSDGRARFSRLAEDRCDY